MLPLHYRVFRGEFIPTPAGKLNPSRPVAVKKTARLAAGGESTIAAVTAQSSEPAALPMAPPVSFTEITMSVFSTLLFSDFVTSVMIGFICGA